MKFSIPLLAISAVLIFSSNSQAQTVIRITGAQAFGDAVHRGILHVLQANGPFTYAYTGTDINKAQQTIWTGSVSGSPVIFKTSYNGSTAGIRVVTRSSTVNWLPNSTPQSAGGTTNASTATPESASADAAAVDTFQSSTVYTSPTLIDRRVGAGAYVFVAGKGAPANLTNITALQAQALYGTGQQPLAFFTGSEADRTTLLPQTNQPAQVFATGRDYESGARLVALIETGIGGQTNIAQYKPVISGNFVTSHALYPAVTINGIYFPEGSDGNPSNGNIATGVLTKDTVTNLGGWYVSYLPTLDAFNAVAGGAARILSYNGVPYSPAAVAEGSYTLWAYEHLLWKNGLTAVQNNGLNALANQILNVDATVLIGDLKVSRPLDGGVITTDY